CWPIDTTYFIDQFDGVDPSFLTHLLRYLPLDSLDTSTTIPGLNRDDLYAQEIALPTLAEQRRIVEKVEALLARVDAARARLAAAPGILKWFRQAVLAAACSGRLTADWRETAGFNDGPARDTTLQGEGALPREWRCAAISEIADVKTGATPLRRRTDYYEGGTIPWVTSGAVNEPVISAASEYITPLALKETNAKLFPAGTLLIALYGEGRTRGMVSELGIEAATNQAVAAIIFHPAAARSKRYIKLFLLDNYQRIRKLSAGGVQPNLSIGIICRTMIPLPPLAEQDEIVRRVESLFALADRVEQRVAAAAARADRLTQAILAKAFRGELVGQEPAEEPAGVLGGRSMRQRDRVVESVQHRKEPAGRHASRFI
ncbi:MAG TPA: restriction endonuclease subunit S, partial [Armatimonadota bacterium]|nr:restriction endonuclease subunit S [Armatimonadota bacterium]